MDIKNMVKEAILDNLTREVINSAVNQAVASIDLTEKLADLLDWSINEIVDEALAEIVEDLF